MYKYINKWIAPRNLKNMQPPTQRPMMDGCFPTEGFMSTYTEPTKVVRTISLPLPPSSRKILHQVSVAAPHTACTSAPANREACMAAGEAAPFGATYTAGPDVFVVPWMVPGDWNTEGPTTPPTTPPAPASHFHDFFGAGTPLESQSCGAEACGAYCRPSLLEARGPYGIDEDTRLHEVLELLRRM